MCAEVDRKILHIDMNSFYASVELLTRPELKDKPVAVGGDENQRHGIVLARNEIAKQYGVKTAETLYQARQKAPNLIVLPAHHDLYREYSQRALAIYRRYSDRVQSFGPDEAWLDLSNRPETAMQLAQEISQTIKKELGLTVSIGVSYNKTFAKMGSDYKKPDAITEITRSNFKEILWPLPVEDLLYVGAATAKKLHAISIDTIGELAQLDEEYAETYLGKSGRNLVITARGEDNAPVLNEEEQGPAKSIGAMRTSSSNLETREEILRLFELLAEEVAERLAGGNLRALTVRIYVRDADFKTVSRQQTVSLAISSKEEILNIAVKLFDDNFSDIGPIRLLGITADKLEDRADVSQLSFLDLLAKADEDESKGDTSQEELDSELNDLIVKLSEQFGDGAVFLGKDLNDIRKEQDI